MKSAPKATPKSVVPATIKPSSNLSPAGARVRAMAAKVAGVRAEDLDDERLEAAGSRAVEHRIVRQLDRLADLAGIDFAEELETFLVQAGARSANTKRAYRSALARFEGWADKKGINALELTPRTADDFALALATEGRAAASVRRDIAAASALFAFLERRYDTVRNPFRGTRARPAKKASKELQIPDEAEIAAILIALPEPFRAAAVVMACRGLRVGALPTLTLRAGRFTAESKGKTISGEIPTEAVAAIKAAGLESRQPFAGLSADAIAHGIGYHIAKLAEAGTIHAIYSAHDFRHAFAVREYRKDKDLYRVSRLLGHASIQVTETYLKGLGEVD